MKLSPNQWFEAVGGLFGASIALAYFGLASWAVGRVGILILAVSVPAGVVLGWLLARLLAFVHRMLSEE